MRSEDEDESGGFGAGRADSCRLPGQWEGGGWSLCAEQSDAARRAEALRQRAEPACRGKSAVMVMVSLEMETLYSMCLEFVETHALIIM